nr:PREDICTED: uncharacterized protein LOC109042973 [Bemisia tabaci]XP_018915510.1 PREDICTED: uncharacterized protein LOC109042973 [Bemisia tabaci]XP_018915512.1 PREDICTED: uncharacterized protein LOC109042973 [Bemisia tabaci]
MDFFERVLRNYETVTNCIRQQNAELLSLQLPTFSENYNLFARISENIDDVVTSCWLSGLLNLFRDRMVECENLLARSSTEVPLNVSCINLPLLREGRNGRARIHIPADQVIALRNCGIAWKKIAQILNISRDTLRNAQKRNHIEDPRSYQDVSDNELLTVIAEIKREHPSAGYRYVWSALKSRGIFVPRRRLMAPIRTIDPIGVLNRRRQRLRRRQYKVKAANYLWHMDGNEKLVNWNMYIHGCVDGLSRKIIYLELSLTKLAEVVLEFFTRGVAENGLPMRVRGDHGTENARVIDFMNDRRSTIDTPFILGKSVHNTRIERMWGEVNRIVSYKFRTIFHYLEDCEVLSQLSLLDLFIIWYVYFPRIQKSLTNFKNSWNQHGLSTVNNRNPNEIWLTSLIQLSYQKDVFGLSLVPERLSFNSKIRSESFTDILLKSNLGLDLNTIEHYCAIFEELVPDPMIDDNREGINLYLTLRNHFYNE